MGIIVFLLIVLLIFGWFVNQEHPKRQNSRDTYHNSDRVPRQLQNRLLRLSGGDKITANRLVNHVQRANPDKNLAWCYQKVIYDLERDKRII